jgi:hypothetical protein
VSHHGDAENLSAVDGSPKPAAKSVSNFWRKQFEDTGLVALRILFLIVTGGISIFIIYSVSGGDNPAVPLDKYGWAPYVIFFGMILLAAGLVAVDMVIREKRLETISAVYFGLLIGLFLAYITRLALTPLLPSPVGGSPTAEKIMAAVQLVLTVMLCYLCISFLLQTRHDFRPGTSRTTTLHPRYQRNNRRPNRGPGRKDQNLRQHSCGTKVCYCRNSDAGRRGG